MTLKYHSIVLLVALTIANCGLSESRGVWTNDREGDLAKSWLSNPAVKRVIINAVLQKQGTSQEQIQNIVDEASGNLEQIVSGINSELKEDVVGLDGDAIRINPEGIRRILKNSVEATIRDSLPSSSPLATALQSGVSQQIATTSPQFRAAVAHSAVPLDVARQLAIRKRSLQKRDLVSDVGSIVSGIVVDIVGQQLSSLLVEILEDVKSVVESWLILTAPGDFIGDLLAGFVNFIVKGIVQVITVIEQSLSPSLQIAPVDSQVRKRRDLGDILGGAVDDIGGAIGGVVDGVVNGVVPSGGLLDTILGPIFTLLADLLTPINNLVKEIVTAILNVLEPLLGTIIVTRVENVILAVIDLFIPSNLV